MRRLHLILICILILILFLRFLYLNSGVFFREEILSVSNLQFQHQTIVIESGDIFQLRLNLPCYNVTYYSKNSLIASVNSAGKVIALKPGNTVIHAKYNEKDAKSRIYVISYPKIMKIKKGKEKQISISGKSSGIRYFSADTSLVTVSKSGKVQAKAIGSTSISFIIQGFSFSIKIIVY